MRGQRGRTLPGPFIEKNGLHPNVLAAQTPQLAAAAHTFFGAPEERWHGGRPGPASKAQLAVPGHVGSQGAGSVSAGRLPSPTRGMLSREASKKQCESK
jgi:hypothetical protein